MLTHVNAVQCSGVRCAYSRQRSGTCPCSARTRGARRGAGGARARPTRRPAPCPSPRRRPHRRLLPPMSAPLLHLQPGSNTVIINARAAFIVSAHFALSTDCSSYTNNFGNHLGRLQFQLLVVFRWLIFFINIPFLFSRRRLILLDRAVCKLVFINQTI